MYFLTRQYLVFAHSYSDTSELEQFFDFQIYSYDHGLRTQF